MDFWVLLTGVLMALNNGLIGMHLVFRGRVMISDAISHAVLPGIVLAWLFLGLRTGIGAELAAALAATAMLWLYKKIEKATIGRHDAALAATFTWMFALGIVLITWFAGYAHMDADAVLFGNLAWAGLIYTESGTFLDLIPRPVWIQVILLTINTFWLIPRSKSLWFQAIDPIFMQSAGLKKNTDRLLMMLTALHAVWSFEQAGAVLVTGLMIFPGAATWIFPRLKNLRSAPWWQITGFTCIFAVIGAFIGISAGFALNIELSAALTLSLALLWILLFFSYKIRKTKF